MDWCTWFGASNPGNISTVAVGCDIAYGVATPVGSSNDSGFNGLAAVREEGTIWAVPIYSCATAAKASIKNVTFSLNGTTLDGVTVVAANDTVYDSGDEPWWGAESTDERLDNTNPLWGLVDPNIPPLVNISTVQKASFYLPGLVTNGSIGSFGVENMPGIDFNMPALKTMSSIGNPTDAASFLYTWTTLDYSGTQSAAMFRKWQNLSSSAEGMAQ